MPEPQPNDAQLQRQLLSRLMDGDVSPAEAEQGCDAWSHAESARDTWCAYHLIGDVLRSEELARPPRGDATFLAALRERLRDEPAVLAPQPLQSRRAGQQAKAARWWAPGAVAAGCMAMAAGLMVLREPGTDSNGGGALAWVPASSTTSAVNTSSLTGASVQAASWAPQNAQGLVVNGDVLRDAQLDRYLRAHRQYGAASPVALPGGNFRGVETVSFER